MLDFTSSHYLGFWHASRSLRPWSRLTTGMPAALHESAHTQSVAAALAALQGLERATLARSTLHIFWDLFGMLPPDKYCIYIDAQAYPIAHWATERAAGHGVAVKRFPHRNVNALQALLRQQTRQMHPVIVTNGICTCYGCTTPLDAYQECIQEFGGLLVVDDTQALGILGSSPTPINPYGFGGGGSLRYLDLSDESLLIVCSLAKAFGAPIASLSGSERLIQRYELFSQTRVHCSPPSQADVMAAERSLYLNKVQGEARRKALLQRVDLFKRELDSIGLSSLGGWFPIQTLKNENMYDLVLIHQQLLDQDVKTILHKTNSGNQADLSFILTVDHLPEQIETAVQCLSSAIHENQKVKEPG